MRRRSVIALMLAATALFSLTLLPSGGRRVADATPAAAIADAGVPPDRDKAKAVPDEVIVRFEESADADQRGRARGSVNARVKKQLPVQGMQLLELPALALDGVELLAARRVERGHEAALRDEQRGHVGGVGDPRRAQLDLLYALADARPVRVQGLRRQGHCAR